MCLLQTFCVEILVTFIWRHPIANQSVGDTIAMWKCMCFCTSFHDDRSQPHKCHKNTAISASLANWTIKAYFLQVCLPFLSCVFLVLKNVLIISPLNITILEVGFALKCFFPIFFFFCFCSIHILFHILFPSSFSPFLQYALPPASFGKIFLPSCPSFLPSFPFSFHSIFISSIFLLHFFELRVNLITTDFFKR